MRLQPPPGGRKAAVMGVAIWWREAWHVALASMQHAAMLHLDRGHQSTPGAWFWAAAIGKCCLAAAAPASKQAADVATASVRGGV